jgi:ParE toxin of type II toxin-antitoxin system, parDE
VLHLIQNVEQLLPNNPQIGRAARAPGSRELIVPRTPYIVPYRIQRTTIQILRVMGHGAGLTAFDSMAAASPKTALRTYRIGLFAGLLFPWLSKTNTRRRRLVDEFDAGRS